MSNRTDWKQVVHEVMDEYVVSDRNRPVPLNRDCTMSLSQRLEREMHNAFVSGKEVEATRQQLGAMLAAPIREHLKQPACERSGMHRYSKLHEGAPCDFCGKPAAGGDEPKNDFEGDDPRTAAGMAGATPIRTPAKPADTDVVWENECRLVFSTIDDLEEMHAEMGLCYPEGREVQVCIKENGEQKLMNRLRGVPVRITISRVPGGNK